MHIWSVLGSRLELRFYFECGKHRERAGILVQNEVHSEKYSNKAVQTDNSRAVRLVVSLSLNGTTRQTAHKLRLTAALCEEENQRHESSGDRVELRSVDVYFVLIIILCVNI